VKIPKSDKMKGGKGFESLGDTGVLKRSMESVPTVAMANQDGRPTSLATKYLKKGWRGRPVDGVICRAEEMHSQIG
jgi:hypothetical protein